MVARIAYPELPDDRRFPEACVREILRRREFEFRVHGLQVLAGWQASPIPADRWMAAVPELFYSIAALQRPSWGHWNGLISSLRKALSVVSRSDEQQQGDTVPEHAELSRVFRVLEERLPVSATPAMAALTKTAGGTDVSRPRRRDLFVQLISLRNRIAHDLPADPEWWAAAASALVSLDPLFAVEQPGPAGLPVPWMDADDEEVWTFNGLRNDFTPVFVSHLGRIQERPERAGEFLSVFRRMLGRTQIQEQDFRHLLNRLAPEELRGVLLGDYLMGPPIGEGGFARVHEARQLSTGRKVALKVLHDGMSDVDRARFRDEAAHLGRFSHQGIVQVLDYGDETWKAPRQIDLSQQQWYQDLKSSSRIRTFIALEWVDGRTLDAVITDISRPESEQITEWFAQSAEALAVVHADGLLHRDVTPRNLMVASDGRVRLMDFGIARDQADAERLKTRTGQVVGTPAYMSPEQLSAAEAADRVGAASDIYSLCATFYEVYTGRRLYDHDTADAGTILLSKLEGRPPLTPGSIAADVPWQVETLLMGGLEREPGDRPASAAELAADLRRAQRNQPTCYRRPSLRRRMLLALRRHQLLARVTLLFGILLFVGAVTARVLIEQQRTRTGREQQRADREQAARVRAEQEAEQEQQKRQLAEQERVREQARADAEALIAKESDRRRLFQEYAADMRSAPENWDNGRLDLLRRSLEKYAAPGNDDPRAFEWYYWKRMADGMVRTLPSPGAAFRLVHLAAGRLYTLDLEGIVRVWDLETLRELFTLPGQAMSFAVSADGRRIATADHRSVSIHNGETGQGTRVIGQVVLADALAFNADGTLLLAGDYGSNLLLWSVPDGRLLLNLSDNPRSSRQPEIDPRRSLDKHAGPVRAVAFSPDGRLAASGSDDGTVKVWNVRSGRYVGPNRIVSRNAVVEHTGAVTSLSFSPDGRLAVSGSVGNRDELSTEQSPGEVRIWDVASGEVLHSFGRSADALPFHDGGPPPDYRAIFSADGTRLLICAEKGIQVRDVVTGELLDILKAADDLFISVATDAGGTVAAVSQDKSARIWDRVGNSRFERLAVLNVMTRAIGVSPDGRRVGAVCEESPRNTADRSRQEGGDPPDEMVHRVWDAGSGQLLPAEPRPVWLPSLGYRRLRSADGRWLAAIDYDGSVTLTSASDGTARHLSVPERKPPGVRPSDPGDDPVKAPWEYALEKNGMFEIFPAAVFSPDGNWLAVWNGTPQVFVWNLGSGQLRVFEDHSGSPRGMAFSADGRIFATGDASGVVRLWDPETGRRLSELSGHPREISALAFSPDGRRLAVAVGTPAMESNVSGEIRLWDTETLIDIMRLTAGDQRIYCGVNFSPDGRRIYAAVNPLKSPIPEVAAKGELVFWDAGVDGPAEQGQQVQQTEQPAVADDHTVAQPPLVTHRIRSQVIDALSFHPGGQQLAIAAGQGAVRLINTRTGSDVAGWKAQDDILTSLIFSPGGGRIAVLNLGVHANRQPAVIRIGDTHVERVGDASDKGEIRAVGFESEGSGLISLHVDAEQVQLAGLNAPLQPLVLPEDRSAAAKIRDGLALMSRDGRWLVAGGRIVEASEVRPAELFVCRIRDGQSVHLIDGLKGSVEDLAFSPDGGAVAVAEAEQSGAFSRAVRISVWSIPDGQLLGEVPLYDLDTRVRDMALAQNGSLLAYAVSPEGASASAVHVLQVPQKISRTLPQQSLPVSAIALNDDGSCLATGDTEGHTRIWNLEYESWPEFEKEQQLEPTARKVPRRRPLVTIEGFSGEPAGLVFAPKGDGVAAVIDGQVRVWNPQTGNSRGDLIRPTESVRQVIIGEDGRTVVTVSPGSLQLTGAIPVSGVPDREIRLPKIGSGRFLAAAAPDDPSALVVLVEEDDRSIRVYCGPDGESYVLSNAGDVPDQLAVSPDGRWVASAVDSEIRLHSTSLRSLQHGLQVSGTVVQMAFSADGSALAAIVAEPAGADRRSPELMVWSPERGDSIASLRIPIHPARAVTGLAVQSNGQSVAVCFGEPPGSRQVPAAFVHSQENKWRVVPLPVSGARSVEFNPDGTQLAVGAEGQIWLLKLEPERWTQVRIQTPQGTIGGKASKKAPMRKKK